MGSHPGTYKNAAIAFKGDNLDRYLMGRQFMVLMVVFTINQAAGPLNPGGDVLGMPDGGKFVFLDIGLGMVIFTCILGQLSTQVIASHCMIDYINNYFALFTLYVCMFVEFTGIMHSSYLIQNILSAASGKPIITNEPPKTGATFAFCMAVTLVALFNGDTMVAVKYPSIPNGVNVFLFFFFMAIVGMLEAMQIAFFAVAKLPASERGTSFFGQKTSELLFKGNGNNLAGFMIGRQLTVVFSFFLVGAITGLNIEPGQGENIFGIQDSAQEFLNFGFHGAVITTILASISWQLAASAFPIAFLNNPFTYILLCVALFLEWTGLCSGAWVLARIQKSVAKFQYDEVYIGTPEERMANNHADKDMNIAQDVGHLAGGGFAGHLAGSRDALDGPIASKDAIDEAA